MNNTGKLIMTFVLTFCFGLVGYFGTRAVVRLFESKKQAEEKVIPFRGGPGGGGSAEVTIPGRSAGSSAGISGSHEKVPEAVAKSNVPVVINVTKPLWNGKTYSFDVVAEGDSLVYCLADENKKDLGKSNTTGHFAVRATELGIYHVYVRDLSGSMSDYHVVKGCTIPSVKKITAEELQRVLTSEGAKTVASKADFQNRVAPGCSYRFIGMKDEEGEEEEAPASYNDIILRIEMGVWSSVEVQGVNYDSAGRMREATIRVIY